jgi:hypothetical protein
VALFAVDGAVAAVGKVLLSSLSWMCVAHRHDSDQFFVDHQNSESKLVMGINGETAQMDKSGVTIRA